MRQVLFRLPVPIPNPWLTQIPIYGFGLMLVVALFVCVWLTGRRAQKEGVAKELIQDLAFYCVIGGILGARVVFMIQYGQPITHFLNFWEGGLVWYGGLLGGVAGYFCAYFMVLRKLRVSTWKMGDFIAPALAMGLCLGRVGCLLNGCCYGGVACTECPGIHFPVHSFAGGIRNPDRDILRLVPDGYQAAAGFTMGRDAVEKDSPVVGAVDASSHAARAGLQPGDVIVKADNQLIGNYDKLTRYLLYDSHWWDHGPSDLKLTVNRNGQEVELPAFRPETLGLHPTQIYESISMLLLFLLLAAYYPFRRHDGEVLLLFLTLYPVHRFLNEMLRNDTDPVAFGLTLSQNGSLLILAVALCLWVVVLRKPAQYHPFAEKKSAAAVPAPV
jgi:phosphatidylglycerol:prolipoprotein diacylglycerol transferase